MSALAREFGPVTGVEPAARMREIAQAQAPHPDARHLAGSAEDMPVPFRFADYALMFLSWHHVQDKPRAVRELSRTLRPGGRLLLRGNFRDHHPRPWWLQQVPRWLEADTAQFQPLHEAIEMFTSDGWRVVSFGWFTEPSYGTLADMLDRLRLRTLSFFGQLDPAEIAAGMRRLEEFVAADPSARRPCSPSRCSRSNDDRRAPRRVDAGGVSYISGSAEPHFGRVASASPSAEKSVGAAG